MIPITALMPLRITLVNIGQEDAMRKYLIVYASATLVLTAAATKAAYFSGHTLQTKAEADSFVRDWGGARSSRVSSSWARKGSASCLSPAMSEG